MKYIWALFVLLFLTACGGNKLPFGAELENLNKESIAHMYDSETNNLDLSRSWLHGTLDLTQLLSDEIVSNITQIDISDNTIEDILLPEMPELVYLDMSDNKLSNEDIKNLPNIKLNKTYLDVSGNSISKSFLEALESKMKQYHPDVK